MNYIYIDTKITGAIKQLISYFNKGIFNPANTTIYFKIYRKQYATFRRLFQEAQIPAIGYRKYGDIQMQAGGCVFYLFNAQSNSRIVADRRLTHIFVTHGESNKVASIKPIIRIYDYVTCAGNAGLQRYLDHKIFTPYDIDHNHVICMGDTFIGHTGLASNSTHSSSSNAAIMYAPTWEGGMPSENYSSLEYTQLVHQTILNLSRNLNCSTIVIRPHPNTGHRLTIFRKHLLTLIQQLKQSNLKIVLHNNIAFNYLERFQLRKTGCLLTTDLSQYHALHGLCDISAIESQFLNENIPYYLFTSSERYDNLIALKNNDIYQKALIQLDKDSAPQAPLTSEEFVDLKNYTITNELYHLSLQERISYLEKTVQHLNNIKNAI